MNGVMRGDHLVRGHHAFIPAHIESADPRAFKCGRPITPDFEPGEGQAVDDDHTCVECLDAEGRQA